MKMFRTMPFCMQCTKILYFTFKKFNTFSVKMFGRLSLIRMKSGDKLVLNKLCKHCSWDPEKYM